MKLKNSVSQLFIKWSTDEWCTLQTDAFTYRSEYQWQWRYLSAMLTPDTAWHGCWCVSQSFLVCFLTLSSFTGFKSILRGFSLAYNNQFIAHKWILLTQSAAIHCQPKYALVYKTRGDWLTYIFVEVHGFQDIQYMITVTNQTNQPSYCVCHVVFCLRVKVRFLETECESEEHKVWSTELVINSVNEGKRVMTGPQSH